MATSLRRNAQFHKMYAAFMYFSSIRSECVVKKPFMLCLKPLIKVSNWYFLSFARLPGFAASMTTMMLLRGGGVSKSLLTAALLFSASILGFFFLVHFNSNCIHQYCFSTCVLQIDL